MENMFDKTCSISLPQTVCNYISILQSSKKKLYLSIINDIEKDVNNENSHQQFGSNAEIQISWAIKKRLRS